MDAGDSVGPIARRPGRVTSSPRSDRSPPARRFDGLDQRGLPPLVFNGPTQRGAPPPPAPPTLDPRGRPARRTPPPATRPKRLGVAEVIVRVAANPQRAHLSAVT